MKIAYQIAQGIAALALCVNLILTCCGLSAIKKQTANENDVQYVHAERMGNVDETGTLFVTPDGNLFAVDAQYATSAEEFLLKMDTHGTPEKTDDEILAVWVCPTVQ